MCVGIFQSTFAPCGSYVCELPIIYDDCVCYHEWAFVCLWLSVFESDMCIRLVSLVVFWCGM